LANIKEIKRLRGGDLQVAAQANAQIDAEIEHHFRTETSLASIPLDLKLYAVDPPHFSF